MAIIVKGRFPPVDAQGQAPVGKPQVPGLVGAGNTLWLQRFGFNQAPAQADGPLFSPPNYEHVGQENPFPADHALFAEWEPRRQRAVSERWELFERLLAESEDPRQVEPPLGFLLEGCSGLFDIQAQAWLGMPPVEYSARLSAWANDLLSLAGRQRPEVRDVLVARLTLRLHQRLAHWTVTARATDHRSDVSSSPQDTEPFLKPDPPIEGCSKQLDERAVYLRHELDRRGLNLESLHRGGGPDRKTTKKVLNGQIVSEVALKRLVLGLSQVNPPVLRKDIP